MSENRRQLLKDAMDNKETYRIPMGFWHHFVLGKDQFQGLERPELLDKIVEGHKRYFETIEPDMMLNAVPNEKYEPAGIFSSVG